MMFVPYFNGGFGGEREGFEGRGWWVWESASGIALLTVNDGISAVIMVSSSIFVSSTVRRVC